MAQGCQQLTLTGVTSGCLSCPAAGQTAELAEAQQQLADCKTALADMQASFEQVS